MGNHEKAVLSKKNKYYISKHRYYELKHFCLQYNEWIEELKKLDSQGRRSSGGEIHSDPQFSDPTAEIAMRRSQLQQNIEMIKDAAVQTDRVLFNYLMTLRIFLAVRFLPEKSLQNQGKSVVKQTPKIMSMYSFPLTGIILIIGNLSEGLKSIL